MATTVVDLVDGANAPEPPLRDICQELVQIGRELQRRWELSLESGDFDQVERLAAASQAVHRAAVTLTVPELLGVAS